MHLLIRYYSLDLDKVSETVDFINGSRLQRQTAAQLHVIIKIIGKVGRRAAPEGPPGDLASSLA